jgi:hypothetical protein
MYLKDFRPDARPMNPSDRQQEFAMHALKDLLTTDVGLMSLAGIVFMLGMGVFFVRYFQRHIQMDTDRAAAEAKR